MGGWIPVSEARKRPFCQQPCQGLSPLLHCWFINVRSCLISWATIIACASLCIHIDCFTNGEMSSFSGYSANIIVRVFQSSQLHRSDFSCSKKLVQGFAAALMVKLQGAVGADFRLLSCFTPRLLFSLFLQLQLLVFLVWDLQLWCYLCLSQFIPGAQQSSPHFRELGKDMTLPVNLTRAVCGRNCRKKSFPPPPASSHHRLGRWCLPAFSQGFLHFIFM